MKNKAKELALKYAAIGAGEKDNPDETAIESAEIAIQEINSALQEAVKKISCLKHWDAAKGSHLIEEAQQLILSLQIK